MLAPIAFKLSLNTDTVSFSTCPYAVGIISGVVQRLS